MDQFDLEDALSNQKEYMCSVDLKEFVEKYHLNLSQDERLIQEIFLAVMMTLIMYTIHREHGIWHAA